MTREDNLKTAARNHLAAVLILPAYRRNNHGYTMRKKTVPLAGFNVNWTLLTKVDPATSTQLLPRPEPRELVCTCKRQPVWSTGQPRVNWLPLTTAVIGAGVELTAVTRRVPSAGRWLVSHWRPSAGWLGMMEVKAPLALPKLKSLKESPASSGSPVRFNFNSPPMVSTVILVITPLEKTPEVLSKLFEQVP